MYFTSDRVFLTRTLTNGRDRTDEASAYARGPDSGGALMAAIAVILFLLTSVSHAQDSQFFFDPNGNLFVQTGATTAPPQIIGQPQNRMVAPGDSASFFVVAADTRALSYQ